jgi:hypothetical protein
MDLREHAFALVSVVLGLALTQLLSNLNDLIAARKHVHWYPLPLIWAATAFAVATNYWWGMFLGVTGVHLSANAAEFLLRMLLPVCLFLLCGATLPKVATVESQRDLRLYYYAERRYYFGLWLFFAALSTLEIHSAAGTWTWSQPDVARLAVSLLMLPLLFTRAAWYHWIAAIGTLSVICWRMVGQLLQ